MLHVSVVTAHKGLEVRCCILVTCSYQAYFIVPVLLLCSLHSSDPALLGPIRECTEPRTVNILRHKNTHEQGTRNYTVWAYQYYHCLIVTLRPYLAAFDRPIHAEPRVVRNQGMPHS
jgi:hypothetical protein